MVFVPDPLLKTTKIPVRIMNGKVEFFYGGDLPTLRDGTVGDLVVPSHALLSPSALDLMSQELDVEILSEPAIVWFAIKPSNEEDAKKYTEKLDVPGMGDYHFVRFNIEGQLFLHLQGTKKATLVDCECDNKALEIHAKSLNHAYRLVSRRLELQRRAHGGNVFLRAFYRDGKTYRPLSQLRDAYEARLEQHLIFVTKLGHLPRLSTPEHAKVIASHTESFRQIRQNIAPEIENVSDALDDLRHSLGKPSASPQEIIGRFNNLVETTRNCVFTRLRVEDEEFTQLLWIINKILNETGQSGKG